MLENLDTISDYLNQCSKCGGCQAVCPLYGETQAEPYVARGKIFLIKNYLEGRIDLSPKMKEIMSLCLLCKACVDNCPNHVPVDRLVMAARREIAKKRGISFIKKNVFQHLLQNNGNLSLAARMGYLYQHSGVQGMIRKSGLLKLISPDLAKKEGLLPNVARHPFRRQLPLVVSRSQPRSGWPTIQAVSPTTSIPGPGWRCSTCSRTTVWRLSSPNNGAAGFRPCPAVMRRRRRHWPAGTSNRFRRPASMP